MDIKILDSHLREYLDTKATPVEIAKYMSLCGPTFDRTKKFGKDYLYEIEVTSNRVDAASILGIAREAAAILPQFGIKARLRKIPNSKSQVPKKSLPLKLVSNPKLENRLTGLIFENVKNWESPEWLKERLEASGMRSLNAVVDITNYIMLTIGHPCHVFDYDKIKAHTITVRESRPGEKITSFDNKTYKLPGGDIVFENIDGRIIDLPGIIGTKNSAVSTDTKKVLLFFDNNNSNKIRRTSMSLGIRTVAATLNEKHVDPELIPQAMNLGINLFQSVCNASLASKIYDIYPKPYREKTVSIDKQFIERILGINMDKNKITNLLKSLGFSLKWTRDNLEVKVPSFRAHDINIPEDIVEEIARIYGYHNLPSQLMAGEIPKQVTNTPFKFEESIRQTLKGFGGVEVLTYSLVSLDLAGKDALKLQNPLGADTEYLRTSLKTSLFNALTENAGHDKPYHIFEIANVYSSQKNDLPKETMMLAGICVYYDYRVGKGMLEALFESLNIHYNISLEPEKSVFYYEFEVEKLRASVKPKRYLPLPKYPPQIEDITIEIPEGKYVKDIIQSAKQASKLVSSIELIDIYERKFTFRITYLHPEKNLSDKEVEKERSKITNSLS